MRTKPHQPVDQPQMNLLVNPATQQYYVMFPEMTEGVMDIQNRKPRQ